jgi:mono/diheme cytochrome c family protein
MPRWAVLILVALAVVALVPFACIARSRAVRSSATRIHPIGDMDNQRRFKSQQPNPLFADGRAMRPWVEGTVAAGEPQDDRVQLGIQDGAWVSSIPVAVDAALMTRGRGRFEIYCAPCHGLAGYGDGPVARRADRLQEGTWVPPSSFHTDGVRSRPAGHIFNTITHGIRSMPAYGSQIPAHDRWAIVAYVRALQRSQDATLADVPPELRSSLDRDPAPGDAGGSP